MQFQIAELLPGILTQLGSEGLSHLKRLANNVVAGSKVLGSVQEEDAKDEDIPDLVENFENVANATEATNEKQAEEIAAKIAKTTIEESAKPTQSAPAEEKVQPAVADEKKETKKENAPKKSPNDKSGKKQQSKDKKA